MNENRITETEYGEIMVTTHAVGTLILDIIDQFDGKVLLSNHKGRVSGLVSRLSGSDGIDNMEISFSDDGTPEIKIYVVIRFGTSIAKTTNKIIEDIHAAVTTVFGREPSSIFVVVSGTISKNIARRNIEVSKYYDSE